MKILHIYIRIRISVKRTDHINHYKNGKVMEKQLFQLTQLTILLQTLATILQDLVEIHMF